MSKKKHFETNTIDLPKGTILEQFQYYLKKKRKVSDIIGFLSIENARLLTYKNIEDIPENLKEEILEFYEYFVENLDDLTYEARMENWGKEPRIFMVARCLMKQEYEKECLIVENIEK